MAVEEAEREVNQGQEVRCHQNYAGELCTVVCNNTGGAPKAYLRKLQESGYADGFLALKLLQQMHDVHTKSSMLREFLKVVHRTQVYAKDLEGAVEAWEADVAKLEMRYNKPDFLSEDLKAAIFLSMIPSDYQDKVYDRMALLPIDGDIDLNSEKEYIFAFNRERNASRKQQNYSANAVEEDQEAWWGNWNEEEDPWANAMGKGGTKGKGKGPPGCWNCGDPSHLQRSPKGKGKGNWKGGGSKGQPEGGKGVQGGKGFPGPQGEEKGGKGKGVGKFQAPWNYNPTGWGYQGVCFKCGKVGHKANECTETKVQQVQGEPESATEYRDQGEKGGGSVANAATCAVEVGGCWQISAVEVRNKYGPLEEE